MARATVCAAAALLAAGCASSGAGNVPPVANAPSSAETAAALDRILAGNQRSESNRARDAYRHPRETLLFFGVRADMRVVEVWPDTGWYTEVIAPLVQASGKYYAAQQPDDGRSKYVASQLAAFRAKLAARPDLYAGAEMTTLGRSGGDIAPPASVDLIVTFRNVHNWMAQGWAAEAFASMYRALKPGGTLGVVEHRGNPAQAQDPAARSGYVNEDYAVRLIEAAGFRLVEKSEINANPRDTKDYPQGVWTLPPSYRLGAEDHDKYAAIGESDRFTLKFIKPRG
jgi:predicted methyltransferase